MNYVTLSIQTPFPLEECPPTAHPLAKKIVSLFGEEKECTLFGTLEEIANFLWENQEFSISNQTIQGSELIDLDALDGTTPITGSVPLDSGEEFILTLRNAEYEEYASLPRGFTLTIKFLSSSDIIRDTISVRMGNMEKSDLTNASWTLVGIHECNELASVLEDVYAKSSSGTEIALPLDVLKRVTSLSESTDSVLVQDDVTIEMDGIKLKFQMMVTVTEAIPRPPPPPPPPIEEEHFWRLSVEIRSVKLRGTAAKVFAKYHYPLLEQTKAFRTFPPVMARKNTTVHFPHAFSLYNFQNGKKESDFKKALGEMFRVEVWKREAFAADSMIGQAFFDLSSIFDQPIQIDTKKKSGHYNPNAGFRLLDLVSSVENDVSSQGVLRCVVFLEDLGVANITTAKMRVGGPARTASVSPSPPGSPEHEGFRDLMACTDGAPWKDTPAYSSVVELELWKRNEEAKFRAHLQDTERQRIRQLEEEYEEKERIRSAEFHVQKQNMVKLEQSMRIKLAEVQKRESTLNAAMSKIKTERENQERKQQSTLEQVSLDTKLLRQELDQNLKLEHQKIKKLNGKIESLEDDVKTWRTRYNELEEQFVSYRKNVSAKEEPLESLKAELKIKQFEIEDLSRKNEVISASRDHFKQAVRQLLGELDKKERERQQDLLNIPSVPSSVHNPSPRIEPKIDTQNGIGVPCDTAVWDQLQSIRQALTELKDTATTPRPEPESMQHLGPKLLQTNNTTGTDWVSKRQELLHSNAPLYTVNDPLYKYLSA